MSPIFHCTLRSDWQSALAQGAYAPPSLQSQGFIHFSTADQLLPVVNALFRGQSGLVLLAVDPMRLTHPLRYENLEAGTSLFPHLYGPLNLDAVLQVLDFPPSPDGTFLMPVPNDSNAP